MCHHITACAIHPKLYFCSNQAHYLDCKERLILEKVIFLFDKIWLTAQTPPTPPPPILTKETIVVEIIFLINQTFLEIFNFQIHSNIQNQINFVQSKFLDW